LVGVCLNVALVAAGITFADRIFVSVMPAGSTRGANSKKCCLDGEAAFEIAPEIWLLTAT